MNPEKSTGSSTSVAAANCGLFVISLDFELYWGMRHEPSVSQYVPRLIGARAAIPAILRLFTQYSIHATWATVGFLFFDRTRTLLDFAPRQRPQYRKKYLNPYCDLPPDDARETTESIHFAPSLISLIAGTANQEIGTHTFSHYFCLEEGQDIESFRHDLLAARSAAKELGIEVRSLVFPQNEFRAEYIQPLLEAGVTTYRGNQPSWIYRETAQDDQGRLRRLGRLLDTYVPVSSNTFPIVSSIGSSPVNICASRFLRPYSRSLRNLEPLRLRRIKNEMSLAAKRGFLYHLWWHPHNFGLDTEYNLAFLRNILEHYRLLRDQYGFESSNMTEAASYHTAGPNLDTQLRETIAG
jgi:peptidoglycan/xylan/chitin deacetylase (PgdA/CDA1 family)